jgi:hypothetical protein
MFKTTTQNRIGYGVLTTGVVLGLFFSWRNDNAIEQVNKRQDKIISAQRQFIIDQCARDKTRDAVIIRALEDARTRARASLKNDPALRDVAVARLNEQIDEIKTSKPCKLPKVKE